MFSRISKVSSIHVTTISFSSLLQIGDCRFIDGHSDIFAMQRRTNIDTIDDINMENYPIFNTPAVFLPLDEPMHLQTSNLQPFISVGTINITGATASSIIGIGNIDHIRMKSRVEHVRKLLPPFDSFSERNAIGNDSPTIP